MSAGSPGDGCGHVLVVDDEDEVLLSLRRLLRSEFDVFTARSAEEGHRLLTKIPIQVIISDQRMPGITGTEFFAHVKKTYPRVTRLLLTGFADLESVIAATNDGHIFRYATKPWNPEELRGIVRGAYEHHRIVVQNLELVGALRALNEGLEDRVQRRTAELSGVRLHDLVDAHKEADEPPARAR